MAKTIGNGEKPGHNDAPRRSPGGQFMTGESGNPVGRPKGARNRLTARLEEILEFDAEEIVGKAADLAKAGDTRLLRACLDRLLPVGRHRTVAFALPEIGSAADLPKASGALLAAVAERELSPAEAAELARLVDAHVRALEASDLNERLEALEEGQR